MARKKVTNGDMKTVIAKATIMVIMMAINMDMNWQKKKHQMKKIYQSCIKKAMKKVIIMVMM